MIFIYSYIQSLLQDNGYEGQDTIGQVIQGEDGELYLLAAGDEDGNPPPDG